MDQLLDFYKAIRNSSWPLYVEMGVDNRDDFGAARRRRLQLQYDRELM